jgi:hypothetical protein
MRREEEDFPWAQDKAHSQHEFDALRTASEALIEASRELCAASRMACERSTLLRKRAL